jgi:hypothetical protein
MKLQIWHNSNLGNPHFVRSVPDIETAKEWLKLLADYDLYQGDRVAANAQGLMVWNERSTGMGRMGTRGRRRIDHRRDRRGRPRRSAVGSEDIQARTKADALRQHTSAAARIRHDSVLE